MTEIKVKYPSNEKLTPISLEAGRSFIRSNGNGKSFCHLNGSGEYDPCEVDDFARFIVRAVNAHDALVEACRIAESNLSPVYASDHLVMRSLRAALAQAKSK